MKTINNEVPHFYHSQNLRKIIFLMIIAFNSNIAFTNNDIPTFMKSLENKKLTQEELIPKGYIKSTSAKGDLNGDGIEDVAMLIHEDNSKTPQYDLQQYVAIFMGDKEGKFSLWKVGTKHFINTTQNQMDENGVMSFEIKRGVLEMATSYAMSMGGWSAGGCTQKWRNGKSGFQLIGITIQDFDRKCACGKTRDVNLVTGREVITVDEKKTNKKNKPQEILWEAFDYDKNCR